MRFVLREFVSTLRESGELDVLLVDLLLAMNLQPLSKPQKGVRQYGVDVAAVGPDLDNGGADTVFLLTVKQGNIGRADWDGSTQAVRQSLDEILDVYVRNHIPAKHRGLPVKVIVCCGGDLRQDVQLNWTQYTARNTDEGRLEFEFWGVDKLATLLEQYLLDEYVFAEADRKSIRTTRALLDINDHDPREFYSFIERKLRTRDELSEAPKDRVKIIRGIHLALRVTFQWAQEADNLRQAVLAAERTVLLCWHWLWRNGLLSNRRSLAEFRKICETYGLIAGAYFQKLRPHCAVRDGLWGYGADEIEYPLRSFEVLGILSLYGLYHASLPIGSEYSHFQRTAVDVSNTLASLVRNNPAALSPSFDGHAIDIGLGLLLLAHVGQRQKAREWMEQLVRRIFFSYRRGRGFPISTDSFDDLVELHIGTTASKEKLTDMATIVPMLAEWCVVFNFPDLYSEIVRSVSEFLPQCTLQLWYPDGLIENHIYTGYAGSDGGSSDAPIRLPATLDEMRYRMKCVRIHVFDPDQISFFQHGFSWCGLLASRHYRTPLMPFYWQRIVT